MNLKSFLFLGAGVLGLGMVSVASAAPDTVRDGLRGIAQELGLTEEQQAELRGIRDAHRQEARADGLDRETRREARRAERDALRAKIRAEMQSDTPDVAWLYAVLEDASDRRLERRKAQLDRRLEVYGVLTPEQRATLAESLEDRGRRARHTRRGDRRHRRGEPSVP